MMTKFQLNWPTTLVVALLVAFGSVHALAGRQSPPPSPAVVATVDLERVLTGIGAFGRANERLEALGEQLDTEDEAMRQEIADLQADLEFLPAGSENSLETQRKIHWLAHRRRAFLEFAQRKISVEQSRTLRTLYDQVISEIQQMSDESAFDVVLVNDSASPMPDQLTEQELMRQISSRRILHAGRRIDITDELIRRLDG